MRYWFLCFLLACRLGSDAQCAVIVEQCCGPKELSLFYKAGQGISGTKLNDSSTIFNFPLTEPSKISILVGEDNVHLKNFWMDPRYSLTRRVTLDHCSGLFKLHDTIPLDIDDAPDRQITDDYIAGRISTQDSLLYYQRVYEEGYITAHPDSFLSLYYLEGLLRELPIEKLIKYRDLVKKNNIQYSALKTIDSYIENYKYLGQPQIGDTLFEFQAKEISGKVFDSRSLQDKVTVLFFWYFGCGPCHRAMPALSDLYEKYKSKGLTVISFGLIDKKEDWVKASSDYKIPGINVSDVVGFSSPQMLHYGVSAFPFFVVFDRNKKISMITFGEDEVPLIESKVKELLVEK